MARSPLNSGLILILATFLARACGALIGISERSAVVRSRIHRGAYRKDGSTSLETSIGELMIASRAFKLRFKKKLSAPFNR
jgi:hypothetical protein